MNKCEHCQVRVDEHLTKCPLCLKVINPHTEVTENSLYPTYTHKVHTKSFLFKLGVFLSIATVSICALINILTLQHVGRLWFLYIAVTVLYLWLLIGHTILSKSRVGSKIFLQTIGTSIILYVIDFNSGHSRWSVNFVIPFLVMAATLFITWKVYTKKMLWNEYIGYTIAMIFLGFIPTILYLVGIANILWASASAALYSLLTIIGMFTFANKRFKNEFKRRFHF